MKGINFCVFLTINIFVFAFAQTEPYFLKVITESVSCIAPTSTHSHMVEVQDMNFTDAERFWPIEGQKSVELNRSSPNEWKGLCLDLVDILANLDDHHVMVDSIDLKEVYYLAELGTTVYRTSIRKVTDGEEVGRLYLPLLESIITKVGELADLHKLDGAPRDELNRCFEELRKNLDQVSSGDIPLDFDNMMDIFEIAEKSDKIAAEPVAVEPTAAKPKEETAPVVNAPKEPSVDLASDDR